MSRGFTSTFADALDNLIDLKVSLGYSESTYFGRARQFDRYCSIKYTETGELTEGIVLNWLKPGLRESNSVIHSRAAFIRGFGAYLKSVGKDAYILPDRFTAGGTVFVPYLFGDEELAALFREIDTYRYPKEPFRPILLSTYFRMTYTCGLRPNEGRNLKRNEVDLNTGEVRIIESKKHKSRTIVMSDEMNSLAKSYAAVRDAAFPGSSFFFPIRRALLRRMDVGKLKRFFALSKPDVPKDLLPSVRVYDLRHRFATAVMNRWLDEKKDLGSRLPYLQTYMGHRNLEASAYYIHLLPKNLIKSAGIDWEGMNHLILRVKLWEK